MWNLSVKHRPHFLLMLLYEGALSLISHLMSNPRFSFFQIPDVLGQLSRCGVLFMAEVRSVFVVALLECGSSHADVHMCVGLDFVGCYMRLVHDVGRLAVTVEGARRLDPTIAWHNWRSRVKFCSIVPFDNRRYVLHAAVAYFCCVLVNPLRPIVRIYPYQCTVHTFQSATWRNSAVP